MRLASYQKFLFAVLALLYMVPYLQGVAMAVVANDIMRDLRLSQDEMGLLGSAYLYAYAASQLVSGMLAAYYGPRRTLAVMFTVSAAGGAVFALADPFWACVAGRAVCGLGASCVMTSAFTLFGRWYSAEAFPRICAVFFSCGGLGTYVGTAPLGYMSNVWGWRSAFLLLAGVTLIYAVIVFLTVRDWPSDGDCGEIGATAAPGERVTPGLLWQSVRAVARLGDFWRLVIWFAGMSGTYFALGGLWAAPYLMDVHHMTRPGAGNIIAMFSVGFIAGNPVLAWLCQNAFRSYRLGLGACGTAALLGILALIFLGAGMGTISLYAVFLCLGMACNAPNAISYAAARNCFGARMTGIAGGVFGCASFVGGAVLQIICGALLKAMLAAGHAAHTAYAAAFSPFILCAAAGTVCAVTLSQTCEDGGERLP